MAFYDLEHDPRKGLLVSIQGGQVCPNNVHSTLNITMLCDVTAGAGYPESPANGVIETQQCAYELTWRSQYACPMCTQEDMRTIAGARTQRLGVGAKDVQSGGMRRAAWVDKHVSRIT